MNLNYLRFQCLLEDIIAKTTPETPYTITNFGNLQPQSYCTKLREAYKFLQDENPTHMFDEFVFSWSPQRVIVRIKGTLAKPLEQFEPQRQTIKANTTNVDHIDLLCQLAHLDVFELPLELPGTIPPNLPPFAETTQLAHTYLIH